MDAPLVAPGKPASLKSNQGGVPAAVATLLVVAYAIIASLIVVPSNVDVSWLLTVGDRVLNGERLYVDIAEGNPPLSTWLYLPFLVIERVSGFPAEIWLSAGVALLAVASVCFSARILARADETLQRHIWYIPVAVFLVLYAFPLDFGQREQLAVIALLPWLALLSARDRSPDFRAGNSAERIVAGVGAGIFVMIKPPYSVLALALPALAIALHRRSLSPLLTTENLVGGVLTVVYVIAIVVFMQPFFTEVLPLLRKVYLPMRMPFIDMLMLWPVVMFAAMAMATIVIRYPVRPDRDAETLLLAGTAYVPAFVIMGKGWTYQALPFLTFGVLAFMLQYIRQPPLRSLSILAKAGTALGLLMMMMLAVQQQVSAFVQPHGDLDAATDAIARAIDHPTAMSIGSRLQVGNPLVRQTGARFVGRHPSAWMVNDSGALVAAEHDPVIRTELQELRQKYTLAIATEVAAKRPDIVLDDGTSAPHPPVSLKIEGTVYSAMPLRDTPAIAKVLQGYRLLHQNASVTVFIRADIPRLNRQPQS